MEWNDVSVDAVVAVAREAGKAVLEIYGRADHQAEYKEDGSPLTLADKASHEIISDSLAEMFPGIPQVSEESRQVPYEIRKDWRVHWLIDPLDGTKEFLRRNGEFSINIALISDGRPVLGVVGVPEKHEVYYAKKGRGAFMIDAGNAHYALPIMRSENKENVLSVVASRSHISNEFETCVEKLRNNFSNIEYVRSGSARKFCIVARGDAQLYPRFGPTMEWDTAAGQIVVEESGGEVCDITSFNSLNYGKRELVNPGFMAHSGNIKTMILVDEILSK